MYSLGQIIRIGGYGSIRDTFGTLPLYRHGPITKQTRCEQCMCVFTLKHLSIIMFPLRHIKTKSYEQLIRIIAHTLQARDFPSLCAVLLACLNLFPSFSDFLLSLTRSFSVSYCLLALLVGPSLLLCLVPSSLSGDTIVSLLVMFPVASCGHLSHYLSQTKERMP